MVRAIAITFDHLLKDHLEAYDLNFKASKWYKIDKVVACLLLLLCIVSFEKFGLNWWCVFLLVAAFLESGVIKQLSLPRIVYAYRFKAEPKFKEKYTLEFSNVGIHFKTQSLDSKIDWSFYKNVLLNDSMALLVYGKHQFSLVPRRAFDNDDDFSEFLGLVETKIGNVKRV